MSSADVREDSRLKLPRCSPSPSDALRPLELHPTFAIPLPVYTVQIVISASATPRNRPRMVWTRHNIENRHSDVVNVPLGKSLIVGRRSKWLE